jgi:hypothetical protein
MVETPLERKRIKESGRRGVRSVRERERQADTKRRCKEREKQIESGRRIVSHW